MNITCHFWMVWLLSVTFSLTAQAQSASHKRTVFVDEQGVMRWNGTEEEVKGFGVNYTVPFAHAFRTGKKLQLDLKKEMQNDVYHFSRLGFDLFRIHVWDTEISDEYGNLLQNKHLDYFDFLIHELKARHINFVLTPIAYWGGGWPEPDRETPGFSHKYGKENSLINPEAIAAQENYLKQFLNHVNPYTGVAYKDEENVIAFEVSNEPHHRESPEKVKAFINKMVEAMKSTGSKKPIFYNVTHSIHLAETYAKSGIDGGTFQWYPTGLGFGKELEGNLLPNVDKYAIPFNDIWKKHGLAKLVYEFDAADVMTSYMYPAMARSFRAAGIQIATHFSYDPTFLAPYNTEYDTHYMNLAFTPSKALALMISGEIFHRLPLNYRDWGYPQNLSFDVFRIDAENDVAEMNSEEKFIYTNATETPPKHKTQLKQIAGFSNSPVVKYEGTGAYFLDKLEEGVWRLEVMPDALLIENPFGTNSLEKTLSIIKYAPREMSVMLDDLGNDFTVKALNSGNNYQAEATKNEFVIEPGTYILLKKGKKSKDFYPGWNTADFTKFVAPESNLMATHLVHEPIPYLTPSATAQIFAEVASHNPIEKVEVRFKNGNTYKNSTLAPQGAFSYAVTIPEEVLKNGFLEYHIVVTTTDASYTFPDGKKGSPAHWDYEPKRAYSTAILEKGAPITLFNAINDEERVVGTWQPSQNLVPTAIPGEAEYRVNIENLFEVDPENQDANPIFDYSFRYNFQKKIAGRTDDLEVKKILIVKARSLNNKATKLQVALVLKNGQSFGKIIRLNPEMKEHKIKLDELIPVATVILPRPFPGFLPYYFQQNMRDEFNIQNIQSVQFSIGPGLDEQEKLQKQGVGIISVRLE